MPTSDSRTTFLHRISFIGICLLAACLIGGCEKVDLGDEEDEDIVPTNTVTFARPTSIGEGTQEAPYTIDFVLSGTDENGAALSSGYRWYIGYVVGSTYSTMDNCIFEAETSYTSNVLVSANPKCESTDECVPVELKTANLQKTVSLYYNSDKFRSCILLKARFGQYFRTNGLRDMQEVYWLAGFDISTLNPTPPEWEEWDSTY